MQHLLRRHLLALMLGVTALSYTASAVLIDSPAFAKNGADDGPGHDAGDDHGGSSGSSGGSDDSDDDNSGSGSDDDGDDDNSGSGSHHDNDNSGSGSDDDDDSNDDNSSSSSKNKSNKAAKASGAARPTATITLTAASLANVQAGTHVVVDQLGRQLEIRVTMVNGQQVIRAKPHGGDAKRNPGPITTINVVPVSAAGGGNDDGTPDQGPGDN